MSPEQCEADPADLDTRTDVYSLGVVLYELLCGQLPYNLSGMSLPKATRAIQENEPSHPSAVSKALRGNVEAIVLKALKKNPAERYQSVTALAQDIVRHLGGESIEARPPTAWARSAQWIGRHPVITTTGSCLAVAVLSLAGTLLSVWWLNLKPDHIELAADGREARLKSLAGGMLDSWTSTTEGGITFAELVKHPAGIGGRNFAVLGFDSNAGGDYSGSLCGFRLTDPREPVWIRRITADDIRASPLAKGFTEQQFGISAASFVDIFPEHPGTEIVAIHKDGPYSPVAIRIYDLSGHLLYQVWHDGVLSPPYWMEEPRLLVFCGLNSEVPWSERGEFDVTNPNPIIVFAVQPKSGHISTQWITSAPSGEATTLAWYKCLLPPTASELFRHVQVASPHTGEEEDHFVRLFAGLGEEPAASISWLIDADGLKVTGSDVPTDRYQMLWKQDRIPDPEIFYLGELAPIRDVP